MRKFSSELVLLVLLLIARTWSSPLPQEEEGKEKSTTEEYEEDEEEEGEGEDEYYGDEEKGKSTSKPEVSTEELDKDDLEDAALRQELAQRLGIKKFSSTAITDKATQVVLGFIASRYAKNEQPKTTTPPKKRVNRVKTTTTRSSPVAITTKKYKILRSTSTPSPTISTNSSNMETSRTFLITVPQDKNGTGGGIIEISIPTNMTSEKMRIPEDDENDDTQDHHHHLSQMSILGGDEQGVKNIEAAIMEALFIAQQMTGMNMNAVMSGDNITETIELDIKEVPQMMTTEMDLKSNSESSQLNATEQPNVVTSESPHRSEVESETGNQTEILTESPAVSVTQEPEVVNPTQTPKLENTTPKRPLIPDPYGLGPLTDMFVSQIRNGKLPTFVWGSIIKLANTKYAQIAVDAVECAVFYYCPDDTELGTLTEGAKF